MKHVYLLLLIGLIWSADSGLLVGQGVSSNEVVSQPILKKSSIKLFPNPATERFSINLPSSSVKYITINDIIGKEIKKIQVRTSQSYDVSDLKRGVYIIRIFDPNDELIKALRLSKA